MVMSVIDIDTEAALRDLRDGSRVDRVLLVRDVQHCTTRTGSEYCALWSAIARRTSRSDVGAVGRSR